MITVNIIRAKLSTENVCSNQNVKGKIRLLKPRFDLALEGLVVLKCLYSSRHPFLKIWIFLTFPPKGFITLATDPLPNPELIIASDVAPLLSFIEKLIRTFVIM